MYSLGTEPVAVMCINGTLLATQEFNVMDWESIEPKQSLGHLESIQQTSPKDQLLDAKQREMLRLYFLNQEGGDGSDRISNYSTGTNFDLIQCKTDVRAPPKIASTAPGLPEAVFYVIVFGSSFVAIGLLMFCYYLKRTNCMKQPFFQRHHEELNSEENQSETKKSKKEIFQTAAGDESVLSTPRSLILDNTVDLSSTCDDDLLIYQQQEQQRSVDVMQNTLRSGSKDVVKNRGESDCQFASSAIRFAASASSEDEIPLHFERGRKRSWTYYDDEHNNNAYNSVKRIIECKNDTNFSSLRRDENLPHQSAVQHDRSLRTNCSLIPKESRSLRMRGGNHRRTIPSHIVNSSIVWSNFEVEPEQETTLHCSNDIRSGNNKNRNEHLRSPLGHQLGMPSPAAENYRDDDDDDDGSVREGGSVIESGASFYSKSFDEEIGTNKLKDFDVI